MSARRHHAMPEPMFALPNGLQGRKRDVRLSARNFHLRRLNDITHLCIQRGDFVRARAAWAILARCEDVNCIELWKTGLAVLGGVVPAQGNEPGPSGVLHPNASATRISYLKTIIANSPREVILRQLMPFSSLRLMISSACTSNERTSPDLYRY